MRMTAAPVSFIKTELTVFACGWALRVSAVRVHTGNKKLIFYNFIEMDFL